jgi:hypothetical protein
MRFKSDKQRRAMFAKMNRAGVSLGPAEVEFRPSFYGPITITGTKEIDLSSTSEPVPDWVTSSNAPKVEEVVTTNIPSDLDYIEQYAKTIKPVDSSINVGEDRSDVTKEADDFLLKYASNIKPKKRLVGATNVDDEYKGDNVKLLIRSNKKKLDALDEVFNLQSRSPGPRIDIKEINGRLSVNIDGKTKTIDIPIGDDIYLNNLKLDTVTKLHEGYRLNESDLSLEERRRLKGLFEDAF